MIFTEKFIKNVEDIAKIVERLYKNESSFNKKRYFLQICKERKINMKKANFYLEKHIIKISLQINEFVKKENKKKEFDITI